MTLTTAFPGKIHPWAEAGEAFIFAVKKQDSEFAGDVFCDQFYKVCDLRQRERDTAIPWMPLPLCQLSPAMLTTCFPNLTE